MSNDLLDKILNISDEKESEEINSIKIFKNLNRKENYEFLRDVQKEFLLEWEKIRDKKCIVGRLGTGSGKTLVSLLMLLAKMHEEKKPVLYLCPTRQLVRQTIKESNNYNIPAKELPSRKDNEYMSILTEFRNSEIILVTTFDRLFNGRSIFGVKGLSTTIEEIGTILIDDAHSCLEKAKEKYTIIVHNNKEENTYYKELKNIFKDCLIDQSLSEYTSLKGSCGSVMQIPYKDIYSNIDEVVEIINRMAADKGLKGKQITFSYNLVIDYIDTCDIYISNNCISIVPVKFALEKIPSYESANKIAMSATFSNYADLIEKLGFSRDSVENPVSINTNDEGGKYFVFPKLYKKDSHYIRELIVSKEINEIIKKDINIVVLVPDHVTAKKWESYGFYIVKNDIDEYERVFEELKNRTGKKVVFVNRYDGLDLKQKMCSLLIIDGLPQVHSLKDKYLNKVLPDSFIVKKETAQILEQGFGRSVRSPSDSSVIILLGDNLQAFILTNSNLKFFSPGLRKQIEFATKLEKLNDFTIEEILGTFFDNFIFKEDNHYLKAYKKFIEDRENDSDFENEIIELASKNLKLANSIIDEDINTIQKVINEIQNKKELSDEEKGWYSQILAKAYYKDGDFDRALQIQKGAYKLNCNLLKPWKEKKEISAQAKNIASQKNKFLNENYLKFGEDHDSKKFEEEINNLGKMLGFQCSMPDKQHNGGPDNLWVDKDEKIVYSIECKNSKKRENSEISKAELGQTYNSLNWTKTNYKSFKIYGVIVHRKNKLHMEANSNDDDDVYVMTEKDLELLLRSVRSLLKYDCQSEKQVQNLLDDNRLNSKQIINNYMQKIKSN